MCISQHIFKLYDHDHVPCNPYIIVLFTCYDYCIYDHTPNFLTSINFVQHTYMITCLMYDIFILFNILYIFSCIL